MKAKSVTLESGTWTHFPFWRLAKQKSVSNRKDESLLSVYLDRGVIPYSEGGGLVHKPAESLEKYQLVEPGDFVLNNQQAWRGSVGVSDHRGIVSPAYLVFELDRTKLYPRFAKYLFRDRWYVEHYMLASLSVGDIQRQIKWPHLRKISVALPSLHAQEQLAHLLDRETARIDSLIEKKARFIALLKEKRAAVITHAVTKGIDPDAAMKEGPFKAVATIPKTWDVSPIGRALRLTKNTVGERHGDYKLLSLTTRGVIERDISENFGKFPESFDTYQEVKPSNFVFCLFDIDETPRTVGLSDKKGMITGAYAVFDCVAPAYSKYLYFLFLHLDTCKGLKPFYTGLRKTIRPPKFTTIRIPFPPETDALRIVEHIEAQTAKIDRLIVLTERSIDLLRERRAALITAAVTGKIDVRSAA